MQRRRISVPEGIGVSPGIAIGIAAIKNAPVQTESKVSVGEPEQELVRLESAIENVEAIFWSLIAMPTYHG